MSDSTFDAAKNYKKVCYRADRDLLNTELNESQDIEAHERRTLLDRVFAQGTIISGLGGSVVGGDVTIADGTVYLDGYAVNVPGGMLSFTEPGEHLIYVDVFRREVGASEDPGLVNPLTGEPTAEREKWIATLQARDTSEDPLPEGATGRSVAPVYVFNRDSGELRPYAGYGSGGEDIFSAFANHAGHGGLDRHPAATEEIAGFMTPEQVGTLADHGERMDAAESDISALQATDVSHDARLVDIETTLPAKADNTDVTAVSDALDAHKGSEDHDPRYFTKPESDDRFAPKSHVGSTGIAQHPAATGSAAGFMSASDKTQLGDHETRVDAIETALPDKADVSDVTAVSSALTTHKSSADHDARYYTKSQTDTALAGKADNADVTAVSSALNTHKSSADHDGRYYTKTQSDDRHAPIAHVGAGGAAHPAATGSVAGFMSSADKTKLDGHVGVGGTAQHPVASGSTAGFMAHSDKTKLDNLDTEIIAARSSGRYGAFASLDTRLENAEAMAIAPATYVVAASDSVRKESAHYICNGTSDQVEINAALNALPAGGGKVLLLAGTYTLSAGIEIPGNSTLAGEGQSTVIKLRNGHNSSITLIKNKSYGHRTCISDLRIDGNKAAQTSGIVTGVQWAGESLANLTSYHQMRGVGIWDTHLGLSTRFTHSCTVSQNMFSNSGGILITRASTNTCIIGNTINYTSLGSNNGIVIQSEDNTLPKISGAIVTGNQMQNCWYGICLGEGTQMCVAEANMLSLCMIGIAAASASVSNADLSIGHVISGNSVIASAGQALHLVGIGVHAVGVLGNHVTMSWSVAGTGGGKGAIELEGVDRVTVQSNTVRQSTGSADYGILIKAGTTKAWVTNNDLRIAGAVTGLSNAGTDTVTSAGNQT